MYGNFFVNYVGASWHGYPIILVHERDWDMVRPFPCVREGGSGMVRFSPCLWEGERASLNLFLVYEGKGRDIVRS